ncbi:MAG: pyridoxamine 5'-phosphate oxidase family protein [Nitriliruptorales bacterium]|nr:pyridoxamine 5'-phosphate oxidase family protein [Nitriliruptorales bacterium]
MSSRTAWVDQHGLRVLDREQCFTHLERSAYGRLAFTRGDRCLVLPVVHAVVDDSICFRSSIGTKIGEAAVGVHCSFQVDDFDAGSGEGWSVLAHGPLTIVRDPSQVQRLEQMGVESPVRGASQGRWVGMAVEEISGRELLRQP